MQRRRGLIKNIKYHICVISNVLISNDHTMPHTHDTDHDALIVGGGHNGLVCAAYLARGGMRVKVLERRALVGGAAVTEEFHPGFRNSQAAYTVSLLHPRITAELDLHGHGLHIVKRRAQNFLPSPAGDYLLTGHGETASSLARLSAHDAAAFAPFHERLQQIADILRDLMLRAPPNAGEGFGLDQIRSWLGTASLANTLRALPIDVQRDLLDLFTLGAGDLLDEIFENDLVKALFGFDAVVGHYASPYAPGSAYVMLHHALGEVNGERGLWGHAIGGMGAITQAMAKAARSFGADIETSADVREIIIENDRACGVVLADGRMLRARAIIANVNPKLLYRDLVPREAMPADIAARMARYQCGSGTFRMNVALARLPDFIALPGIGDHLTAGIILAPSLGYMDRAYQDARAFGWSRAPIIEMLIPSTLDDTLAPAGQHVASLFCQHVAPHLPDGTSWDERRDDVARLMIDTVETYAPGFAQSVIAQQVLSPLDLERTFGLTDGDIFHGRMTLNQLFSARPLLGQAAYRGAVNGLYLCGAGTHPGGGVTGAPGHNAARCVLRDFRSFFHRL